MGEAMQIFFIKIFETGRDTAKDSLREYFKGQFDRSLDLNINIRYCGVLQAVKKTILVCQYMAKNLTSRLDKGNSEGASMISKCLF
jgi:hypothetical protein